MDNYFNSAGKGADPDYWYLEEAAFLDGCKETPENKDIKRVVGAAIAAVPGVLGLKGGLSDLFKKDDDLTRGISVHFYGGENVRIKAKVIAEKGYNEETLAGDVRESIRLALAAELALTADRVSIEIADTMTPEEFCDKCDAGQPPQ